MLDIPHFTLSLFTFPFHFPYLYTMKEELIKEKHDIANRADIELLVNSFYDKVKTDPTIGFFFTKIIPVDFPAHLPKMYAFWESILFGTSGYKGEPMTAHVHIHEKHKMEHAHFEKWLSLFTSTVDELFAGPKAEEIKQRSSSIATIMEWKVVEGK